jgi:arylsulfatase A-like enzyme
MRRAVLSLAVLTIFAVGADPRVRPGADTRVGPYTMAAQAAGSPRLVVLIVVDQMRADYFQRYTFADGFKRFAERGAVFTGAWYPYASNKTAQAHALMVSGWSPSASGIVGDRWYNRRAGAMVTAAASADHKLLETGGEGGSPEQMMVHTVGDALKAQRPRSMVWTASWKRYTAVMNGGHHPDAAFWLDEATGHMATSDYYAREYPAWAARFAHTDLTLPFFKTPWLTHAFGSGDAPDQRARTAVRYSPASNTVLLDFASALFERSGVGADADPDFVALSFSGVDFVGHEYGPETPEFDDTILKLDRQLGDLLRALDARFGAGGYAVALTADHGAPLLPEKQQARAIDAGKMNPETFRTTVDSVAASKLGIKGPVVTAFEAPDLYLNYPGAAAQGASRAVLDRAVVAAAESQRGVARAYTVDDIAAAAASHDPLLQSVAEGYYADRSGDIYVLVKPNYMFWGVPAGVQKNAGIQHGTPYEYDAHVPLIFLGAGIKPGRYTEPLSMKDLAPTLGKLLGISYKGDPSGRVRSEALIPNP